MRNCSGYARRWPSQNRANAARPDTHDYSEAETRDYFIDLLLKEAVGAGPAPGPRVRGQRHAKPARHGLRGLCAVGR